MHRIWLTSGKRLAANRGMRSKRTRDGFILSMEEISDTFRRARRRLQDRRRTHRQSKKPERQPSGRGAELDCGEVVSAGTPRGGLPLAVTATADIQQPPPCLGLETEIGNAIVVPDAEGSRQLETNRAPD
jgi:hypothetical protein